MSQDQNQQPDQETPKPKTLAQKFQEKYDLTDEELRRNIEFGHLIYKLCSKYHKELDQINLEKALENV
jgi:hypothetical protein